MTVGPIDRKDIIEQYLIDKDIDKALHGLELYAYPRFNMKNYMRLILFSIINNHCSIERGLETIEKEYIYRMSANIIEENPT